MDKLTIKVPESNAPGYLLRTKRIKVLLRFLNDPQEVTEEQIDEIVEFILGYVTVPKSRAKASEIIWNASMDDFIEIINMLGGESEAETVPLKNKDK